MASPSQDEQLHGMWISDTSIRQPVFVTMVMLLAVVVGLLAYRSLPVNFFARFLGADGWSEHWLSWCWPWHGGPASNEAG